MALVGRKPALSLEQVVELRVWYANNRRRWGAIGRKAESLGIAASTLRNYVSHGTKKNHRVIA